METSKDKIIEKIIEENKEFQAQLEEDIELTKQAVSFVLREMGTSGSRALASVILHCYNSNEWKFDINELGLLDRKRLKLAWAVMRLRVAGKEPHEILERPGDIEAVKNIYEKRDW